MLSKVHSIWAYIALTVLVLAVINAVIGLVKKKDFTHKDFRLGLFTLIAIHTQLLLGIIVWLIDKWYLGFSEMKNSAIRLLTLEHPLMMVGAIVLVTVGWSRHKKKLKSEQKFKTLTIFYGLALLLILSRIPWANWF